MSPRASLLPIRPLAEVLDLDPLLGLAWRTAWSAGRFLRDERPDRLVIDVKSSPTDAVTEMDRRAEAMIIEGLLAAGPDDAVLGEEGGGRAGRSGVRWVIDPLDGTVNYLYEQPMWGVSIAAERDGRVDVGVIAAPEFGEGYIGVRGFGSWRVDGPDAHPLRATGFGYDSALRRRQAEVVTNLIPQVRDVRRSGAAVLDFCWLARGRLDAFYEKGLNPWDYSAGALIAREAGAVVTGLHDDDLSDTFVASAPGIAPDLRALLVALGADLR
jgi:myo-inositol-1(or 4)-monophosphatase